MYSYLTSDATYAYVLKRDKTSTLLRNYKIRGWIKHECYFLIKLYWCSLLMYRSYRFTTRMRHRSTIPYMLGGSVPLSPALLIIMLSASATVGNSCSTGTSPQATWTLAHRTPVAKPYSCVDLHWYRSHTIMHQPHAITCCLLHFSTEKKTIRILNHVKLYTAMASISTFNLLLMHLHGRMEWAKCIASV